MLALPGWRVPAMRIVKLCGSMRRRVCWKTLLRLCRTDRTKKASCKQSSTGYVLRCDDGTVTRLVSKRRAMMYGAKQVRERDRWEGA